MKNRDRDDTHRRRRGNDSPEDEVDGREVADALYGGPVDLDTDDNEADEQ